MVPGSWLSVLLFLLLVAPGVLFDLLSERRRAGALESAFREAGRVVLASLLFTGASLCLLGVARAIRPGWFPDVGRLVRDGPEYVSTHYRLVARTLVVQCMLALAAAWLAHEVLARRQGGATISSVSAWTRVFKEERPIGHDALVRVRLAGGVVYSGRVAHFSPDLAVEDRELVLAAPITSKVVGSSMAAVPAQYQRVVLRGSAIEVLSVEYRPSPSPPPTPRRRRRARTPSGRPGDDEAPRDASDG